MRYYFLFQKYITFGKPLSTALFLYDFNIAFALFQTLFFHWLMIKLIIWNASEIYSFRSSEWSITVLGIKSLLIYSSAVTISNSEFTLAKSKDLDDLDYHKLFRVVEGIKISYLSNALFAGCDPSMQNMYFIVAKFYKIQQSHKLNSFLVGISASFQKPVKIIRYLGELANRSHNIVPVTKKLIREWANL